MKLGVNIDHIATVRRARNTPYPSVRDAVLASEAGGADFITAHLREDRRHIVDDDLPVIINTASTFLNLEAAATAQMQAIILATKPRSVCIVPEERAELTTEGGLEVHQQAARLDNFCKPLHAAGIEVSLFIDPEEEQILAAAAIAPTIEIHTGLYAKTGDIKPIQEAISYALGCGLKVNAGHGLNIDNVSPIAAIVGISELNIGHAIVARALFIGLKEAVREMANIIAKQNQ